MPKPDRAPESVNFDALWRKAFAPLIEEMGYEPVRADQDTGAAINPEMLERLYFSDLVVADMSLPNGNVYYEVGIRHANRCSGCLLVSADWAAPLFDVNQIRRLTYPLLEGSITDATARAIRDALRNGAGTLAQGTSPVYQHIPGFPDATKVEPQRASAILAQLDALSAFQAKVRAVQLQRDGVQRRADALALRDAYPGASALSPTVAIEVVMLLRDAATWEDCIAYIDTLPESIRQLDMVQEQRCLALSKEADHLQAIGALEELIRRRGASADRHGLIGGRYKKLAQVAEMAADAVASRQHLDQAIAHYEQGMQCDLNDYYPSCNLPRLYKARGEEGDDRLAETAATAAVLACERARARGSQDEWLKPTLLGLAFDAGDVAAARRLSAEVRREGSSAWKLETTLADLERSVQQTEDDSKKAALATQLQGLRVLLAVHH